MGTAVPWRVHKKAQPKLAARTAREKRILFFPNLIPISLITNLSVSDEKHWPTFEYGTEIASNKFRVNNREFLVSKLNPQFKRIWNPICKTENALCSTEFMVFKPKNDEMKSYCYSVADGIAFYNFMVAHASSSTGSRKRFPAENIQFFKFAHPGKNAILEQFDSIQKENLIQISLCYASIEKLIALRDWLLPMLMNGQVTVEE